MEKKNKKTKWTKKRHAFITALAHVVLYPIIKLKYHIKFKKFKERKGRLCATNKKGDGTTYFCLSLCFSGRGKCVITGRCLFPGTVDNAGPSFLPGIGSGNCF